MALFIASLFSFHFGSSLRLFQFRLFSSITQAHCTRSDTNQGHQTLPYGCRRHQRYQLHHLVMGSSTPSTIGYGFRPFSADALVEYRPDKIRRVYGFPNEHLRTKEQEIAKEWKVVSSLSFLFVSGFRCRSGHLGLQGAGSRLQEGQEHRAQRPEQDQCSDCTLLLLHTPQIQSFFLFRSLFVSVYIYRFLSL
ncbi:putative oxidoreductase [Rosa chinensis]|uniref:Putative oxidoreductase n=1 Tax=Rosa chinensis TaxID=74649 RepID=A0A2P6REX0_ROSCH|nr:putative oxidoreductase [Rosa chinensis]